MVGGICAGEGVSHQPQKNIFEYPPTQPLHYETKQLSYYNMKSYPEGVEDLLNAPKEEVEGIVLLVIGAETTEVTEVDLASSPNNSNLSPLSDEVTESNSPFPFGKSAAPKSGTK